MNKKFLFNLKTFFLILLSLFNPNNFSKLQRNLQSSSITILRSAGYEEGAFVEWEGPITKYQVSYKQSTETTFTTIDTMLIRRYPTYYRADALGLKPGSYVLKITIDSTNEETITPTFTVTSYDRSGFTWARDSPTYGTGVGAYNLDGTLKLGAKVLYVTEATKTKIKMKIKGKLLTGISEITQQIKDQNNLGPFVLRIIGQVSLENLMCEDMKSSYALGVKEASQITIEGVGEDATLNAGVAVIRSTSVEIRNLGLMLWGGGRDGDGISIKETRGAWIHNNDIFYGVAGNDNDQQKGDGSMDLKDDSQFVTISYNHFFDSGKMSLCGMKSETGQNWISYHHNWFDHSDSRHPRIRTMSVHVYNNYYDGIAKYGVGVTSGGEAFVEKNYFRHCKYPMLISGQGSDILTGGTFSNENGGMIKAFNNIIIDETSYKIYSEQNTNDFDAYEALTRYEFVPSDITVVKGGTGYSNFDCNDNLMYEYNPLNPEDVPEYVMKNAGRVNGGDFKFVFNESDDVDYDVNEDLMNMLKSYVTKVVSIGNGDEDDYKDDGDAEEMQKEIITTKAEHNFSINGLTSVYFEIEGNVKEKEAINYNGLSLSYYLKLESKSKVSFTVSHVAKLTLVTDSNTSSFNLDDETVSADSSGVTVVDISAGKHTITKAGTGNLFYIKVE